MFHPIQPSTSRLTRRALLQGLRVGATLAMIAGSGALLQACAAPRPQPQRAAPNRTPTDQGPAAFSPDVELKLTASPSATAILPGAKTATWSYHGEVLKGDPDALVNLTDSYLGPILRLRKGQKVRIHFQNELPEATIIHWHGLLVPSEMDGHPSQAVANGQSYVYEFEVKNRAGTYWFHPHPHGTTAQQVMHGLAGLLLVSDDEEAALTLPTGEFDVPLVLQDRTFDTLNQFVYNVQPMGAMGNMGGMANRSEEHNV